MKAAILSHCPRSSVTNYLGLPFWFGQVNGSVEVEPRYTCVITPILASLTCGIGKAVLGRGPFRVHNTATSTPNLIACP